VADGGVGGGAEFDVRVEDFLWIKNVFNLGIEIDFFVGVILVDNHSFQPTFWRATGDRATVFAQERVKIVDKFEDKLATFDGV